MSPCIYPSLFLLSCWCFLLLSCLLKYTAAMIGMMTYENFFSLTWLTYQTDRLNEWMEQMRCYTKRREREGEKKSEVFMSSDILTVHTVGGCKCKWRNSRYTHYKTNMPIIVSAMSVSSSSLYNISWRKKVRQGGGGLHKSGSYTYIHT